MNFEDMLNGAMARMNQERRASATNMRLGQFIDALRSCAPTLPLVLESGGGVSGFISYRGYYEDLCIQPQTEPQLVGVVLGQAQAAMGEVFQGYKGGDYPMHRDSLLWVSGYGTASGNRLTGVRAEADRVVIETTPAEPG